MNTMISYTREDLSQKNSDEIRKIASELKIKNYTTFSKSVLSDMIISKLTRELAQQMMPSIENQPKKEKKDKTPKPGSKSEKILAELRNGDKSMYAIAKALGVHPPMVINVRNRYIGKPIKEEK